MTLDIHGPLRLLLKNPIFAMASPHDLGWLLKAARQREVEAETLIFDPDTEASAVLILMDGLYEIGQTAEGGKYMHGCSTSGGDVIGLDCLVNPTAGMKMPRVVAKSPCKYMSIPAREFYTLFRRSSAFQQAMSHLREAPANDAAQPALLPPEARDRGTVVQFHSLVPGLPLSLLIYLLAQEIVRQFPADSVAILRPESLEHPPGATQIPGMPRLFIVYGKPELVRELEARFGYVFLDDITYEPDLVVSLICGVPDREKTFLQTDSRQPALLQTVVLTEQPRQQLSELQWVGADWSSDTVVRTARLRVDLAALRTLAANWTPLTAPLVIGPTMRRSIAGWARAVTQRRTGLALAGGGVWSMQAIHVIRELHRRNVPIDVITSSSSGSMIGAYYAYEGLEGLDRLLAQADSGQLDAMAWVAIATSPESMRRYFARTLGEDTTLESLELEFHPFSTNLSDGTGVALVSGPLSTAIAASSASVPTVASLIYQGQRLVDGAFSSNVPVQALSYFNATLTFGLNTFPVARRPVSALPHPLQVLCSVGPFSRLLDFATALNTLGSLAGALEADWAKVGWNCRTTEDMTYLRTLQFCSSSEMVETAVYDRGLNLKIDEFEAQWRLLRNRGTPPPRLNSTRDEPTKAAEVTVLRR